MVRGSQGQPVSHPLIAEVHQREDVIRRCLAEIGFSPTARARLGLVQVQTASKMDELAAKREQRGRKTPKVIEGEVEW